MAAITCLLQIKDSAAASIQTELMFLASCYYSSDQLYQLAVPWTLALMPPNILRGYLMILVHIHISNLMHIYCILIKGTSHAA